MMEQINEVINALKPLVYLVGGLTFLSILIDKGIPNLIERVKHLF